MSLQFPRHLYNNRLNEEPQDERETTGQSSKQQDKRETTGQTSKQQDKRQTTAQTSNNWMNVKQQDELENPESTAKRLPIVKIGQ